ncbi:MAG: Rpn family recombination-promoting nuclease/putative transposase [Saprospiraceae bacterium]|nr:Rpn family recombination-promoting nuclease/putative transposase [Saprospiraceae bacterium]
MNLVNQKFINPLTDFGFKKLFGSEPNKNLLIDFLNEILPSQHIIDDLTYAKNEHVGQQLVDRTAIFDIYCKGKNGESFIVEIQKAKQNFFKERSVYYSSFPIQEQAKKGDWNYKLQPVYTVGVLDFKFDEHKNDQEILHLVELKDQNCEVFYDKLKFIYIELPKFNKTEDELETHFDKWLFVFTHLSKLQDRPPKLQEKIFQQLFEAAEIANLPREDKEAYEESLKHYMDIKNVVDTSRLEGHEEGRQEGLVEGKKQEKILIAKMMKENGETLEKIVKYTGLTKNEIEKI